MTSPRDPQSLYEQFNQAYTVLLSIGVEPEFAAKLIIAVPRHPGRAHAILFREVMQCSTDEAIIWIELFHEFENRITALCQFPTTPHTRMELMATIELRDKLGHAFDEALSHVYANMPPMWETLVAHYWHSHTWKEMHPERKGLPQRPSADPSATLMMAIIVDHLKQQGKRRQYRGIAHVIQLLYGESVHAEEVRTRVYRSRKEMKARGIDRNARLATVEKFWFIKNFGPSTVQKL
jgi:hypothetical protein